VLADCRCRSTNQRFVRLFCMTRSAWPVRMPASRSRASTPGGDDLPDRDEAVDILFRRHYPDLLRLAYCLLGDRSHAEDAVQDAFVSTYLHWATLRDPAAAPSYLRSAVINRCRTRIRDRVRDRTGPSTRLTEPPAASSEDTVVALDEGSRLVHAVRGLPRRQREVVVCRYFLELSVAETAETLDIAVGSVKRHAHRGIEALAAHVGEEAR
jgi:RNA polymerase sigma-70 factor (sigma-E family)